eukprot:scaffold12308_cov58-Phaeocystis_antarctica.AAC.3
MRFSCNPMYLGCVPKHPDYTPVYPIRGCIPLCISGEVVLLHDAHDRAVGGSAEPRPRATRGVARMHRASSSTVHSLPPPCIHLQVAELRKLEHSCLLGVSAMVLDPTWMVKEGKSTRLGWSERVGLLSEMAECSLAALLEK